MFLGWDRDFKRHQGKHAEQTVLSCVAGYQCQVRRGWLCFLFSVCVRMEDSKPVSQALSTVSMDIFKVDYGKIFSHWVGQPKKMTRDRPGQEAFQDTWWGGDFFHTVCPIFAINLLGGFFALGWSVKQDLPHCSFNGSNKNNPTAEPVSSLGLHTEQWVMDKGMGDSKVSPQEDGTQYRWWLSHCCGDGAAFP